VSKIGTDLFPKLQKQITLCLGVEITEERFSEIAQAIRKALEGEDPEIELTPDEKTVAQLLLDGEKRTRIMMMRMKYEEAKDRLGIETEEDPKIIRKRERIIRQSRSDEMPPLPREGD